MIYIRKTGNSCFFRKKGSYIVVATVFSRTNSVGKIDKFGTEYFHEVITVFQRHLLSAKPVSQIKSSRYVENNFPEVELNDLNCRLLVKLDQHYLKQPKS